jgi:hypothetical protein
VVLAPEVLAPVSATASRAVSPTLRRGATGRAALHKDRSPDQHPAAVVVLVAVVAGMAMATRVALVVAAGRSR